ncbi:uncharacterized protein EAF01_005870 [Botrytis porri]|nr:uncharacterized protein EAF01_005870 [Botrytis porri]KAF7905349.1 hypothetical protein EAF01_005870 [Botrytis porri]
MEPNTPYRSPRPSNKITKGREMVDQQVGGESSSKGSPLPVNPSSKCPFDHLTNSQASVDVCHPGSVYWESAEGRGSTLLEYSDIEMGMEVAGHGNGERTGGAVGSVKPRVRLPVMTQGTINSVAITQLQDELEDAKKELDKQRAISVPSKDEIILPKRMNLPQMMEMFPAVGDQINAKMDQKLNDVREEYEMKLKRLQDDHNEELLRIGAIASEAESRLLAAEEKLRGSAVFGQRSQHESFGNVLPGIQNSHGPSRHTTSGRQDIYQPAPLTNPFRNNRLANGDGPSTPLTTPFRNNELVNGDGSTTPLTNPFRNNRWANSHGQKRGYDERIQPEFRRDGKRVKREQF